jgi:hypothetical protein
VVTEPASRATIALRRLHSGHIGDYVARWATGAAALGGACVLALR